MHEICKEHYKNLITGNPCSICPSRDIKENDPILIELIILDKQIRALEKSMFRNLFMLSLSIIISNISLISYFILKFL